MTRLHDLTALREQIDDLSSSGVAVSAGTCIGVFLRGGAIHEWFGRATDLRSTRDWTPPLALLLDTAERALATTLNAGPGPWRRCVWIGRRVFPYPPAMRASVRRVSIFVDPPDEGSRLWAIDLALRAGAVVVADGHGLTLTHTRRLQLAARAGTGLALMARPPREQHGLSTASTRWSVWPSPTPGRFPRWTVALMRCKDAPGLVDEPNHWLVEWRDGTGLVTVPALVGCGAGGTAPLACSA